MKTNTFLRRHCIFGLVLLLLPAVVQAQFTYATNNDAITITGYNGPGGTAEIPSTVYSYPVTSIGEGAFAYCTSLTNIFIPTSVTNIGEAAFLGCTSLTNIIIANSLFRSINGILFDAAQDAIIDYPAGRTNGTYTLPASVTSIGAYAFASCVSLTNMFVNATSVGDFAFYSCTHLTSVIITNQFSGPENNTNISIGEEAFAFCASLTNVFLANTVTNIGQSAFFDCTSLTNIVIPNSVINIGGLAFALCANLTSCYFQGNAPPDVGNVFFEDPATVYYLYGTIGWGTTFGGAPTVGETPASEFYYSIYDGSIIIEGYNGPRGAVGIPSTINGYSVTVIDEIGNEATSVTIPNSVTNIEDGAFQESGVTTIIIPGSVISIGNFAFQQCGNLTNVTIENGVTSIGQGAFASCNRLTSITIPGSVNSFGQNAFSGCTGLTSVTILNGVTSIGLDAFQECFNLTNLIIPNSVANIGNGAFQDCESLTSVYFEGNAPPDVGTVFDPDAVVYYLPGTTGWNATFGGAPTELWNPQASALATTGGQFVFNITGPTNATIVVEACTNLANPVWLPVSTNALSASGVSSFSDPQWTHYSKRYYRFSAP